MGDEAFVTAVSDAIASCEAAQAAQDRGTGSSTRAEWQAMLQQLQGFFDELQGGELDLPDKTMDELEEQVETQIAAIQKTYLPAASSSRGAPGNADRDEDEDDEDDDFLDGFDIGGAESPIGGDTALDDATLDSMLNGVDETALQQPQRAFGVGDKVEGNYGGNGQWFPATVTQVLEQGTHYDLKYDDGDVEEDVPATDVRKHSQADASEKSEKQASSLTQPADVAALRVGDRVQANFGGAGTFYSGTITQIGDDGSGNIDYDVQYDDGEFEEGVPGIDIRRETPQITNTDGSEIVAGAQATSERDVNAAKKAFAEGDRVEANFGAAGTFYPGVVTQVGVDDAGNPDYDVQYDDGEFEEGVPETDIRLAAVATASPSDPTLSTKVAGSEASAADKVTNAVTADANGQRVVPLDADVISRQEWPGAKFAVGDRVEGNFGGAGAFYPAVVTGIGRGDDGSPDYDLKYDDGEVEEGVPSADIQLIPDDASKAGVEADWTESDAESLGATSPTAKLENDLSKAPRTATADGHTHASAGGTCTNAINSAGGDSGTNVISEVPIASRPAFRVGQAVEANFGGAGTFYPATVTAVGVSADGADDYDLRYDDGEIEEGVPADDIRVAGNTPAAEIDGITSVDTHGERVRESGEALSGSDQLIASTEQSAPVEAGTTFEIGERVEANFGGAGTFYGAKISAIGTSDDGKADFDLIYDDGEIEEGVPATDIRRVGAPNSDTGAKRPAAQTAITLLAGTEVPGTPTQIQESPDAKFAVGDRVEGNFGGAGAFYPAVVTGIGRGDDGSPDYDLKYDDGEVEEGVPSADIQLIPDDASKAGVEADWTESDAESLGATSPTAKLENDLSKAPRTATADGHTHASAGGTCTNAINSAGGDSGTNVISEVPIASRPAFRVGQAVEANFGGAGTFYPATVTAVGVSADGADDYDLRYDDGEIEEGVPADDIRVAGNTPAAEIDGITSVDTHGERVRESGEALSGSDQLIASTEQSAPVEAGTTFEIGERVEANFGGAGTFYSAKISAIGTSDDGKADFDLIYDDGEIEEGVPATDIRRGVDYSGSVMSRTTTQAVPAFNGFSGDEIPHATPTTAEQSTPDDDGFEIDAVDDETRVSAGVDFDKSEGAGDSNEDEDQSTNGLRAELESSAIVGEEKIAAAKQDDHTTDSGDQRPSDERQGSTLGEEASRSNDNSQRENPEVASRVAQDYVHEQAGATQCVDETGVDECAHASGEPQSDSREEVAELRDGQELNLAAHVTTQPRPHEGKVSTSETLKHTKADEEAAHTTHGQQINTRESGTESVFIRQEHPDPKPSPRLPAKPVSPKQFDEALRTSHEQLTHAQHPTETGDTERTNGQEQSSALTNAESLSVEDSGTADAHVLDEQRNSGSVDANSTALRNEQNRIADAIDNAVRGGTPEHDSSAASDGEDDTIPDDLVIVAPWQQVVDEASGDVYFWNVDTDETSWDVPAALWKATRQARSRALLPQQAVPVATAAVPMSVGAQDSEIHADPSSQSLSKDARAMKKKLDEIAKRRNEQSELDHLLDVGAAAIQVRSCAAQLKRTSVPTH